MTNSEAFKRKHGIDVNTSLSLGRIAGLAKMPVKALQEVYRKGLGAYNTNPESVRPQVNSAQQWAMGRVYSFVQRKPATFGKADKHITDKYNL
jgi:hypothetical protein